jgi:hypothetical protein
LSPYMEEGTRPAASGVEMDTEIGAHGDGTDAAEDES